MLKMKEDILRNKIIPLVKIHWYHQSDQETTYERKKDIKEQYHYLVSCGKLNFKNKFLLGTEKYNQTLYA